MSTTVLDGCSVVTMNGARAEFASGHLVTDGTRISAVGEGPAPRNLEGARYVDASGCLATPGLVNTHHHLYQWATRGFAVDGTLFEWLTALYPVWGRMDAETVQLAATGSLAWLARSGCTTTTDHNYVFPRGGGDVLAAEIEAARAVGLRFHPTRGSMDLGESDGGLPPDNVVEDIDEILAATERAIDTHHDPSFDSMLRIGVAPCSPFSVTGDLLVQAAELARAREVRLHTHLCETEDETAFCLERFGRRPVEYLADVGWMSDRVWLAHTVWPSPAEVARLGAAGVGAAHCPSSNMILGSGLAPIAELRAAGAPVGLGVDGSASADSASLWLEARTAMLQGKLRHGAGAMSARDALEIATRGGASVLGRAGEIGRLSVGACGDLVVWPLSGVAFAGALSDPVEAWLRCGPVSERHTVVAGRLVVEDGAPVHPDLEEQLAVHRRVSARMQEVSRA